MNITLVVPQPATQHASPCFGLSVGKHAAATPGAVPIPIDRGVRNRQASKLTFVFTRSGWITTVSTIMIHDLFSSSFIENKMTANEQSMFGHTFATVCSSQNPTIVNDGTTAHATIARSSIDLSLTSAKDSNYPWP